MRSRPPLPLPENAGLAFLGEAAWAPASLTPRQAETLAAATNTCGRPNSDVLRRRLAVVNHGPVESWQIDFPDHFTAQEAALYAQPFALLQKRSGGAWLNPHAQPALRRALARVSRFLATPVGAATPDWRWIEEDLLPDATLLVVARDDDFIHGVLRSTAFGAWRGAHFRNADATAVIESFPFPWPPTSPLGSLSKAQQDQRSEIARSARTDNPDRVNATVAAAYGWPNNPNETAWLAALRRWHGQRTLT